MLNKAEKTRILYVATFVWSEWKRFCDQAGRDSWAHREGRQSNRDALQSMKYAGLIEDYDLERGVMLDDVWHKDVRTLPKTKKRPGNGQV